ncbi:MAG: type II secretion system F family protein [Gammaproteobacteria bacterium]|nr:type II secretion system F family protein [Gammaproteobacteria bacterium]
MPVYSYEALSINGTRAKGEEIALSEAVLREELARRGLLVQVVRPKRRGIGFPQRKRITPETFMLFNQEFTALLRSGLTIPEALKLAADRPDNPVFSQVLHHIETAVRGGTALSEACAQHSDVFDSLYLAALKTGEKTGALAGVLAKYQVNLRQRVELQRKIGHAMAYPIFLLITLVVILTVLFIFVLPRFVTLYADFGAQLPFPTRVLISLVRILPYLVPLLLVAGVLGGTVWRRWLRNAAMRVRVDRLKEKLPLLGNIQRHTSSAQLARTLSTLLSGGMPLVEAMQITAESLTSRYRGNMLNEVRKYIIGGATFTSAVLNTGILPATAVKMIEVGEASGGLESMLVEVAIFHEEALANSLTRMMALIEPVLMLLIGVFVGGIIIVMYLPIFYIVDVIK